MLSETFKFKNSISMRSIRRIKRRICISDCLNKLDKLFLSIVRDSLHSLFPSMDINMVLG